MRGSTNNACICQVIAQTEELQPTQREQQPTQSTMLCFSKKLFLSKLSSELAICWSCSSYLVPVTFLNTQALPIMREFLQFIVQIKQQHHMQSPYWGFWEFVFIVSTLSF